MLKKTAEHLSYELNAIRELCRISEVCSSPALKAYAKVFNARRKTLELELSMRRLRQRRVIKGDAL